MFQINSSNNFRDTWLGILWNKCHTCVFFSYNKLSKKKYCAFLKFADNPSLSTSQRNLFFYILILFWQKNLWAAFEALIMIQNIYKFQDDLIPKFRYRTVWSWLIFKTDFHHTNSLLNHKKHKNKMHNLFFCLNSSFCVILKKYVSLSL